MQALKRQPRSLHTGPLFHTTMDSPPSFATDQGVWDICSKTHTMPFPGSWLRGRAARLPPGAGGACTAVPHATRSAPGPVLHRNIFQFYLDPVIVSLTGKGVAFPNCS